MKKGSNNPHLSFDTRECLGQKLTATCSKCGKEYILQVNGHTADHGHEGLHLFKQAFRVRGRHCVQNKKYCGVIRFSAYKVPFSDERFPVSGRRWEPWFEPINTNSGGSSYYE